MLFLRAAQGRVEYSLLPYTHTHIHTYTYYRYGTLPNYDVTLFTVKFKHVQYEQKEGGWGGGPSSPPLPPANSVLVLATKPVYTYTHTHTHTHKSACPCVRARVRVCACYTLPLKRFYLQCYIVLYIIYIVVSMLQLVYSTYSIVQFTYRISNWKTYFKINSRTQAVIKNVLGLITFYLFHSQSFRAPLCSSVVIKYTKIYEIKVMKLLHTVQLNPK